MESVGALLSQARSFKSHGRWADKGIWVNELYYVSKEPVPAEDFYNNYPHRVGFRQDGGAVLVNVGGEPLFQWVAGDDEADAIGYYPIERADSNERPEFVEEIEIYCDADVRMIEGKSIAKSGGYEPATKVDGMCLALLKSRYFLAHWGLPTVKSRLADKLYFEPGHGCGEIQPPESIEADWKESCRSSAEKWADLTARDEAEITPEPRVPNAHNIRACFPHRSFRLSDGADIFVNVFNEILWIRHNGFVVIGDLEKITFQGYSARKVKNEKYIYRNPEDLKNGLAIRKGEQELKRLGVDSNCWELIDGLQFLQEMKEDLNNFNPTEPY